MAHYKATVLETSTLPFLTLENQLRTPDEHTPASFRSKPDTYVMGGYQSPDILLFDMAANPIPLGSSVTGSTALQPNTAYKLSAIVHNDSNTDAPNTVVRFWAIPGGKVDHGYQIDQQTVMVPAGSAVQVDSVFPFLSAAPGLHSCVAVSVYNSRSMITTVDPVSSTQLPWTFVGAKSATAFRSTDSIFVYPGKPWRLSSVLADHSAPSRLVVEVQCSKSAAEIEVPENGGTVDRIVGQLGSVNYLPLELMPELRNSLPHADLKVKVKATPDGTYKIEGEVPWDARTGDRFLVSVTAKYPDRTVQFSETLFVGPDLVLKS